MKKVILQGSSSRVQEAIDREDEEWVEKMLHLSSRPFHAVLEAEEEPDSVGDQDDEGWVEDMLRKSGDKKALGK